MNELIRFFWNAAAITGAVLVGVFTHDAGFIALTFFGGLIVPRMLGLVPRRNWLGFGGRGGWGRGGWGPGACGGGWQGGPKGGRWQRFDTWHQEAHGQQPVPPTAPPASTI
jgi:hypothetical protein